MWRIQVHVEDTVGGEGYGGWTWSWKTLLQVDEENSVGGYPPPPTSVEGGGGGFW